MKMEKTNLIIWVAMESGLGRIIACLIENNIIKNGDKIKGFSLPYNIAPYKIHIIYGDEQKDTAENLYDELTKKGINCIIDDREKFSFGERIKDCYALGSPYMAILGKKFDGENVEIEETKTGNKLSVKIGELANFLLEKIQEA